MPLASNSETASEHDARLSPGLCDLMLEGSVIHGPEHAALLGEVLVDVPCIARLRLLSSITRVPRRNVMEVPGQRWQAARKVASATSWSSTPATCSTMLSPSGVHVSTRKVK